MTYSITRLQNGLTVLEQPENQNVTVMPSSSPKGYTPDQLIYTGLQGNLLKDRNPNYVTIVPPILNINSFVETAKSVSRHGKADGELLGKPVTKVYYDLMHIAVYNNALKTDAEYITTPPSDPYWTLNECLQLVYHGPDPKGSQLTMPTINGLKEKYIVNENGQIVNPVLQNLTTLPAKPPSQAKPQFVNSIPEDNSNQRTPYREEPILEASPSPARIRRNPAPATPRSEVVERTQVVSPGVDSRRGSNPPPREAEDSSNSNIWKWALGIFAIISITSTLGWMVSKSNANKDAIQQQRTEVLAQQQTNNIQQKTIDDLKLAVDDLKAKEAKITTLNNDIDRLNQDVSDLRNQDKKIAPDTTTRVIQERTNLEQQLSDLKSEVAKQTENASGIQAELAKLSIPNKEDFDKLGLDLEAQTKKLQENFASSSEQFAKVDSGLKKLGNQFKDFQAEWDTAKPKIEELQSKTEEVGKKVDQTLKSISEFIDKQYQEQKSKK
jgi:uncharacterized protein YoxC